MTTSAGGLRLMVYDRTFVGRPGTQHGLTASWIGGALLYRGLGRFDHTYGASSWADALAWLALVGGSAPVAEIQFWGHGRAGCAFIARDRLDAAAVTSLEHPLHAPLLAVSARLSGPHALWWFRTCESFGTARGHTFARAWTSFFGCRAAGHTYVIGPLQSGLHTLAPREIPRWSITEGQRPGAPADGSGTALMSSWGAPHTITCLHGSIPAGY